MKTLIFLVLSVLAATLVHGWPDASVHVDYADASQYIAAAHHLAVDNVFSETGVDGPPKPTLGREPFYPLLVSVIMKVDPKFSRFDIDCLSALGGCGGDVYASLQVFNGFLIGISGLLVWIAARILTSHYSQLAAGLAGAHVWLNFEAASSAEYAISDYLSLALGAGLAVALARTVQTKQNLWFGLTGSIMAMLVLTKAVFLYFALLTVPVLVIHALRDRTGLRAGLAGATLLVSAFAVPTGAWMARNADIGGTWSISTGRTAIVLSTREVFNHMSLTQYATAFVYWTRGFGDSMAKDVFPESAWRPFEIYEPDGFYIVGQTRLGPEYSVLTASGLSSAEADSTLTRRMISHIFQRPAAYVASMAPLFWRGIWIDEFIVVSLPTLAWLLWSSIRRCRWATFAAASPGVYSLIFYTAVSLNIPRYQLVAMPALAIAFGLGLAALWRKYGRSLLLRARE